MNDPDMAQYSGTPEESAALERESFIRMNARRAALEDAAQCCQSTGRPVMAELIRALIDKLDKEPKP